MFQRVVGAFNNVFEMNSSNLSGAIDIVVCEDEKSERKGTNFHARFGIMKAFNPKGKAVRIYLNGIETCLFMRLGLAGECYFESADFPKMLEIHKEISKPESPRKGSYGDSFMSEKSAAKSSLKSRAETKATIFDVETVSELEEERDSGINRQEIIKQVVATKRKKEHFEQIARSIFKEFRGGKAKRAEEKRNHELFQ